MKSLFATFILALSGLFTLAAQAVQADSDAPLRITASRMEYDDVKQVNTFMGNVRLTRGTLIMKGERLVVRQNPAGDQHATLYAGKDQLASFRQKRDGGPDLWVEGYAQRMEYDSKTEVSKLFYRARLLRLDGKKIIDEVNGNYISYDSKTDIYTVRNVIEGDQKTKGERIKIILPPKEDKKSMSKSNTDEPSEEHSPVEEK